MYVTALPPVWPCTEPEERAEEEEVGEMLPPLSGDGEVEVPLGGKPVAVTHMLTLGDKLTEPLGVA